MAGQDEPAFRILRHVWTLLPPQKYSKGIQKDMVLAGSTSAPGKPSLPLFGDSVFAHDDPQEVRWIQLIVATPRDYGGV